MIELHDLIIIGAGPAGLSAAIYAARLEMKTLLLAKGVGGQMLLTGEIFNWLGVKKASGAELAKQFEEHLKEYKVEFRKGVEVKKVQKKENAFVVESDEGNFEAKSVIVASGASHRRLKVKGEKEFERKGVAFCATCDAPLFKGKDVAVVGGGNSALQAALQLIPIAKKIFLLTIDLEVQGETMMLNKVLDSKKVELLPESKALEIFGKDFVEGVRFEREGKEQELKVQGVFVEIGSIPNSSLVGDVKKTEFDEIIVNRENESSVPGLFAAGDVTDIPAKQAIVAAGEGAKAAIFAFEFVSKI